MATYFCILAWEILWTDEPGRLQLWIHKESDLTEAFKTEKENHLSNFYKMSISQSQNQKRTV